jgi:hypothetical protein
LKDEDITDAGINYQAVHTARLQRSRQKVTEHSVGVVGGTGDNEHIASMTLLRSNVNHPIVSRLC